MGYKNCRDAPKRFDKQQHTEYHSEAVIKLNMKKGCGGVRSGLNKKADEE